MHGRSAHLWAGGVQCKSHCVSFLSPCSRLHHAIYFLEVEWVKGWKSAGRPATCSLLPKQGFTDISAHVQSNQVSCKSGSVIGSALRLQIFGKQETSWKLSLVSTEFMIVVLSVLRVIAAEVAWLEESDDPIEPAASKGRDSFCRSISATSALGSRTNFLHALLLPLSLFSTNSAYIHVMWIKCKMRSQFTACTGKCSRFLKSSKCLDY